jgi:putative pyruvate formate lyase activating enzyme
MKASYIALHQSGELARRAKMARELLASCTLCPRRCGVNRLNGGARGVCGVGELPVVAAWNVHPWEEPPISGTRGSGTVFFSGCTGKCIFCQNYPISQMRHGLKVSYHQLAEMMLELQDKKHCHNINFVTPTHFMPAILTAVDIAAELGLHIPLVYNTSGYETIEALQLLEGVIDIYLPDAKYANDEIARQLSGFTNYVEINRAALMEIYRQMGDTLILDENGIAVRGLIIRHLVLPENLSGTPDVLRWIAKLSPHVHVSLMDQYFPAYTAHTHPHLGRKITLDEYKAALEAFDQAGLENGWMQEHDE